ncbi:facilitated trehalose transporter Tret1-2 homolog [Pararge aegeria]|uniref:facilitated trehalose transporter Tret1-2 homolog n=1 Tax=Pararge aegeria TaxID=116150 RepID=UPI0019CF80FE|nr:facilitated trehalose transporter Tret1-2 homolog [Pararge aegeria]
MKTGRSTLMLTLVEESSKNIQITNFTHEECSGEDNSIPGTPDLLPFPQPITPAVDNDRHTPMPSPAKTHCELFSCSSVVLNFFIFGLFMGAPTVVIPQITKEANSTNVVTLELTSWLSSISAYCAVPWGFILPCLAHRFGRKILMVLVSLNVLIGNVFFYCSINVKELIISQAMQGMLVASVLTVTLMVMSEYTSPKYRGIFFNIKAATFYWGVWVSNVIGTFYNWRNISIVIFICGFYNLSSIFCCESPYWLATKGSFDECTKVHRWLKGTDDNAEKELGKLIFSQKVHLNNKTKVQLKNMQRIKIMNIIRCSEFFKPLAYACLPIGLYNLAGKVACSVYAIDIIKKITSSEEMAYKSMLIIDAVTVVSMYLGCALSKFITRRNQLLIFATAGVTFLYVLSLYLYLINLNILSENNYITLFFLVGFSIAISCGPIMLSTCCLAELTPLRYRSYFICCLSFMGNILFATVLKISPLIFKLTGSHGGFLFYAVSESIFILLSYKYLPETKDKTIQEIQEYILKDHNATVKTELFPMNKPEFIS